jgi:hypothetical protein
VDYLSSSQSEPDEPEITKEYTINLKVSKAAKKKITYHNPSDDHCDFYLESSDPSFM